MEILHPSNSCGPNFVHFREVIQNSKESEPGFVIEYLCKHKEDSTVSLAVSRNGRRLCTINPNILLPLGSTVKLIIAVEYARQVAEGYINPNELVSLEYLMRYYVPDTDGGAFPRWINYLKENNFLYDGKTTLRLVAKGMILQSVNTNTDYLIARLGLDSINKNIRELCLINHQTLFPLVGSLYIPDFLQQEYGLTVEETIVEMKKLPRSQYSRIAVKFNKLMKKSKDFVKRNPPVLINNEQIQKIWSDRLPAASANDYLSLSRKLNCKNFFPPLMQKELDKIVQNIFEEYPSFRDFLCYGGRKGGSTLFLLTNVLYATDLNGNQTEIVVMFNHLTETDSMRLMNTLIQFNIELIRSKDFRKRLITSGCCNNCM